VSFHKHIYVIFRVKLKAHFVKLLNFSPQSYEENVLNYFLNTLLQNNLVIELYMMLLKCSEFNNINHQTLCLNEGFN
jgi:hypothetical protein